MQTMSKDHTKHHSETFCLILIFFTSRDIKNRLRYFCIHTCNCKNRFFKKQFQSLFEIILPFFSMFWINFVQTRCVKIVVKYHVIVVMMKNGYLLFNLIKKSID
jgi:hypothetical protein